MGSGKSFSLLREIAKGWQKVDPVNKGRLAKHRKGIPILLSLHCRPRAYKMLSLAQPIKRRMDIDLYELQHVSLRCLGGRLGEKR